MKKRILTIMMIAAMMFSLMGCSYSEVTKVEDTQDTSMFIYVERAQFWDIVYHKDTKVMYAISTGHSNFGTFTLLVDANGAPLLWEEK